MTEPFKKMKIKTPKSERADEMLRRPSLAGARFPKLVAPKLKKYETAPAPALMHWFDGEMGGLDEFSAFWFETGEVCLYMVEGPDNGPPLVLLPGQIESWYSYKPSLKALSDHFRVIVMELRGHGFSQRAEPDRYRVIDYARDVEALVRHYIGTPAYVAGNSLGGVAVFALGQHCPDILKGAFLEDPPYLIVGNPGYKEGWLHQGDFRPAMLAMKALQEDGLTMVDASRINANGPMLLPGGDESWPHSFFGTSEARGALISKRMNDPKAKSLLEALPANTRAKYLASIEDYIETGNVRRKIDYLPLVAWDLAGKKLTMTDWNCPNSMELGIWLDGVSETEGMLGLTMPTVFWEADRSLVPFKFGELQTQALELLKTNCEKFLHVEAEGSPHEGHHYTPEAYTSTIIKFFLG